MYIMPLSLTMLSTVTTTDLLFNVFGTVDLHILKKFLVISCLLDIDP